MGHIGVPEIIVIALVIIVLFGVKRLPEIGSALGKAIKEFRKAGKEIQDEVKDVIEDKDNEQKSK
jgi:sec-independent protein translocase protein TatA